ncbi:3-methyl-2-oxobutanoate hydroxymethyltransferase [Prescottella defluvii]|nr:3-methyl-2-oxobutanoate hydroxymethyltransferase [Prescottella defluvii]
MSETAPYGSTSSTPSDAPKRKTRIHHLQAMKAEGTRWAELTAYDYSSARLFEEAGIPVLLVGDSAANVVYGYDTTVPVTIDEMLPLVRGVVRGAPHALVIADLPVRHLRGVAAAGARNRLPLHEGGAGPRRQASRAASGWPRRSRR